MDCKAFTIITTYDSHIETLEFKLISKKHVAPPIVDLIDFVELELMKVGKSMY